MNEYDLLTCSLFIQLRNNIYNSSDNRLYKNDVRITQIHDPKLLLLPLVIDGSISFKTKISAKLIELI